MNEKKQRPEADRWPGGYVRHNKTGRTYIIERRVGGVHFHISTRCKSLRAAMKQLERFEADPGGYSPTGETIGPVRDALSMTSDLVLAYCNWMRTRENPASSEWIRLSGIFLADWIEDLAGKDLRSVRLIEDLNPALERRKSRRNRIVAIKAFYAWLRKKRGLLHRTEDPTEDLPVPPPSPEKNRRRKVVPRERVLAVLPYLPEAARDVLILQTGTAWHITEVSRFASTGSMVKATRPGVLYVLQVKHKSGELTRTPLQHEEHAEAARRIQVRGEIPTQEQLSVAMGRACVKAGVPQFRLGQMRHSVLTWAVEEGASIEDVAEFAHHRSSATTRRFYTDVAEPAPRVPVLRVLSGGKKESA